MNEYTVQPNPDGQLAVRSPSEPNPHWRQNNAEEIGRFIKELRSGLCIVPDPEDQENSAILLTMLNEIKCPVIDATDVREQVIGEDVDLYEDHTDIRPIWPEAMVVTRNKWGNVSGQLIGWAFAHEHQRSQYPEWPKATEWESSDIRTGEPVQEKENWWDDVDLVMMMAIYVGGMAGGRRTKPIGPVCWYRIAFDVHGCPVDINIRIPRGLDDSTAKQYVDGGLLPNVISVLRTFMLAGCSNVELVTPQRPRAERRRIERTGTNVQTIVVKKTSKSYRHVKGQSLGGDVPQSFVRGHFAKYGIDGRKKLFGKYTGRYWVPAHVRGSTESADREIDYKVEA